MPESASAPGLNKRVQAIALMSLAVFMLACNDTAGKWLNGSIHPVMTTWARYAGSQAILLIVLNPVRDPTILSTHRPVLQIARSMLLLVCTLFNYIALVYLQLTQVLAITFALPLVVALLSGPLLGEWAGPRRLAAVGVGFGGILLVTRPWSGSLHPAAILAILGTVSFALYVMVTRKLAAADKPSTTTFFTGVAGVVLTTPALPFVWVHPPSANVWLLMGFVGLASTVGHWLLVLAHARAPAPVLSPFIYTQIVWTIAAGYLVFGDVPDIWTLSGAAIVICSGLYLLWWERVQRQANGGS